MPKQDKPLPASITDPHLNQARAMGAFTQGLDLSSQSLNQVSANYHAKIGNPMFIQAQGYLTPDKAKRLGREMMNVKSPFTDEEVLKLADSMKITDIKQLLANDGFIHQDKVGTVFTNGLFD